MSKHPKRITPGRVVPVGQPTQFGWDKRPDLVTCQHGFVLDPGEECAECGDRDAVKAASLADFDRPLTTDDLVARFSATVVSPPPAPQTSAMATPKQVDYLLAIWDVLTPPAKRTPEARKAAGERAAHMTKAEASAKLDDLVPRYNAARRAAV